MQIQNSLDAYLLNTFDLSSAVFRVLLYAIGIT